MPTPLIPRFDTYLSEYLADLRASTFSSQQKAAAYFGVDRSTISRYENGTSSPRTPVYLIRLAILFLEQWGTSPSDQEHRAILLDDINNCVRHFFQGFPIFGTWEEMIEWTVTEEIAIPDSDTPQSSSQRIIDLLEAPAVDQFLGRGDDVYQIEQWIRQDNCRLICLLGIGGVGKTSLAAELARQIQTDYDVVIWRSLRSAPPLDEILFECLQRLGVSQSFVDVQNRRMQVRTFSEHLNKHRCLIVFDNVEDVMDEKQAGGWLPGYEEYGEFFAQLCTVVHDGCVLLTTREKPTVIGVNEGSTSPVRTFNVQGLPLSAAEQLLKAYDLTGASANLIRLANQLSGNPMVLKIIADFIRQVYDKDVDQFIEQGTIPFQDVGSLLGEQFRRLSEIEQTILHWLAINREPVDREALFESIWPIRTRHELLEAIHSLRQRAMIEIRGQQLMLQSVIMEFVTEQVIRNVVTEIGTAQPDLLCRLALMQADASEYIQHAQRRVIIEPILDRVRLHAESGELERSLFSSLLNSIRSKTLCKGGYGAGNFLNLLGSISETVSDWDLTDLNIRQAHLQQLRLHNVDMRGSRLSQVTFAKYFASALTISWHVGNGRLAIGTTREIQIWNGQTLRSLLEIDSSEGYVWAVAFSPDGRYLASGGGEDKISVWDTSTGTLIQQWSGHQGRVKAVAYHPSGQYVVSGGDDKVIRVWDLLSGKLTDELHGHAAAVESLAFSSNGRLLACASSDKLISIWDVSNRRRIHVFSGHKDLVRCVAFVADSSLIASCSADGDIRIWDLATEQCIRVLSGHHGETRSIAVSHDGSLLVSGGVDETVRLWDLATGSSRFVWTGHSNMVHAVSFSPDDRLVVSAGVDRSIRFWDVQTGRQVHSVYGSTNVIWSLAISPDGRFIAASCGGDEVIRVWSAETYELLQEMKSQINPLWMVAFSPDSKRLVTTGADRRVIIWDVESGEKVAVYHDRDRQKETAIFVPGGNLVAIGKSDRTIILWNYVSDSIAGVMKGHHHRVRSLALHPTQPLLASSSEDRSVRIWNLETLECVQVLTDRPTPVGSLAFTHEGRHLVMTGERTLHIWSMESEAWEPELIGHTGRVRSVAVHPFRRLVASGGADCTIRIWHLDELAESLVLNGHDMIVRGLAFTPDGEHLFSTGHDGTIRIWNVNTGDCIHMLRPARIYEGLQIHGVSGIPAAQYNSLLALGAVENVTS